MSAKTVTRILVLVFLALTSGAWLTTCGTEDSPAATEPAPTAASTPTTSMPVAEPSGAIPFDSVYQGDSFTAEVDGPTIFVAGSADDAASFSSWLEDPEVVGRIEQVDYDSSWLVAVFRGMVGSSGYTIAVEGVERTPEGVQVTAALAAPPADQMVSDVISFPYHIIVVPRADLQAEPGAKWILADTAGTVLAETTYP